MLALIWQFIVAHQDQIYEVIAAIVSASAITAATKYPKSRGPLGIVLRIIDAISIARHKDSPSANISLGGLPGFLISRMSVPGWLSPPPVTNGVTKAASDAAGDIPKFPVMMLCLLSLSTMACAPNYITVARKSLAIADQVQVAGAKSFGEYDLAYQRGLDSQPDSVVAEYRVKQNRVLISFKALADASHATKAGVDMAASKQATGKVDLGPLLKGLVSAAKALQEASQAIGFTVPGLSTLIGGF